MIDFLRHLLLPRHSNNHRSKILHHSSLLILITFFLIAGFTLRSLKSTFPDVLGESVNIAIDQLLTLTNQKRQEQGLSSLTLNPTLSQAAEFKARDMFAKNYWAHNGPDGTTPWFFFKEAGYNYIYAGENLARGFNSADDAVKAWMASPTHRENVLSPNYSEIGFTIEKGNLTGEETILIVEMFGSRNTPTFAKKAVASEVVVPKAASSIAESTPVPTVVLPTGVPIAKTLVAPMSTSSSLNSKSISWNVSTMFLFFFLLILTLDMVIVERRKIVRLVGHNIDHMLFLGGILLIILKATGIIL